MFLSGWEFNLHSNATPPCCRGCRAQPGRGGGLWLRCAEPMLRLPPRICFTAHFLATLDPTWIQDLSNSNRFVFQVVDLRSTEIFPTRQPGTGLFGLSGSENPGGKLWCQLKNVRRQVQNSFQKPGVYFFVFFREWMVHSLHDSDSGPAP